MRILAEDAIRGNARCGVAWTPLAAERSGPDLMRRTCRGRPRGDEAGGAAEPRVRPGHLRRTAHRPGALSGGAV